MEVERKFLIESLPAEATGARSTAIEQGYLVVGDGGSEARLRRRDGRCTLTVKAGTGISRAEVETALTVEQFELLWPATEGRRLVKTRHELGLADGLVAELDVYAGSLTGLIVAEVEFAELGAAAAFSPPDWFGVEVTDDDAYKNRRLAVDGRPGS